MSSGPTLSSGATRDPDAQLLVDLISQRGEPDLWERGVDGARSYLERGAVLGAPGPTDLTIEDTTIPVGTGRLALRVYRPLTPAPHPVVTYFHGGGWVVGGITASDAFCRRVAAETPCVVVSVGYRLAPEHPFPAAVEDSDAAVRWAAEHLGDGGSAPLIVLGDSAGGNLATVAARHLRDEGSVPIARQILAYPAVGGDGGPWPADVGSQWPITEGDRVWFFDQYAAPELRAHPDIAPINADLPGMPPTTMLLGGCDPLLTEGLAYADRLAAVGVPVDTHVYSGQIHGFLTFDPAVLPRSAEALGVVVNAIRATVRP